MRFETLAIHAGQPPDPTYGAVITPIYQTSTFAFEDVGKPGQFDYSRSGNPTRKALEDCLAALENGTNGYAFATGMAAEATFLALYGPGDHLIVHKDLYGGTYRLLAGVIANKSVEISFVDLRDLDEIERAIRRETRLIWIETPTNPLMNLVDLRAIADLARSRGVKTICDNTFLSPYFQRPLDLGIDVVTHSTTKYINGHSDVVGGALVVRDPELAERVAFHQNALGTCAGPFDCFLTLRGVRTLAVRMEAHFRSGLALARWLQTHPKVSEVLHPYLEDHPQHELALRQSTGHGGTFSFRLKGGCGAVYRLLQNLQLFFLAESLGGPESLIEHPYGMTHASMPESVRLECGISDDLIRVSVGLEHIDDLIEDMERGLAAV